MKTLLSPRTPVNSVSILGCRVDIVPSTELVDVVFDLVVGTDVSQIVTGNSLMCLEARHTPTLKTVLEHAAVVTPESAGLVWAIKILTNQKVKKIPGIDMAYELCERTAQRQIPVFFLGGAKGVADKAGALFKKNIPHFLLAGCHDGFFTEADVPAIIEKIKSSGAKLTLVGLGMPRQEFWIYNNKKLLPPGVYIGVGGSFDVWAGNIPRAPIIFQKMGLEWLYRLIQEPFRIGRILRLPYFAFLVVFETIFQSIKRA